MEAKGKAWRLQREAELIVKSILWCLRQILLNRWLALEKEDLFWRACNWIIPILKQTTDNFLVSLRKHIFTIGIPFEEYSSVLWSRLRRPYKAIYTEGVFLYREWTSLETVPFYSVSLPNVIPAVGYCGRGNWRPICLEPRAQRFSLESLE